MTAEVGGRVLFGVTASVTAETFLRGQLAHFNECGWDVHIACGERGLEQFTVAEGATLHVVRADREPSLRDLQTLGGLVCAIRAVRPDATVMGTPKLGVLGTIAAWVAGVPTRIYLVHGYRAETLMGLKRRVVAALETLACTLASDVIAVSPSLRDLLVREGIVAPSKVRVLGSGSANGVGLHRFAPPSAAKVEQMREDLDIPRNASVVAFVGRLTKDKGLQELPALWTTVLAACPSAWLLVAGPEEPEDEEDAAALRQLRKLNRVRIIGRVDHIERVYQAVDVLLVLSRREGLGMVALEAAACGVPTVGFQATGVVDAVVAGETGILSPAGNLGALSGCLIQLLGDGQLRKELGEAGLRRVQRDFSQMDVWRRWVAFIRSRVDAGRATV